jgi:hypothetical protein
MTLYDIAEAIEIREKFAEAAAKQRDQLHANIHRQQAQLLRDGFNLLLDRELAEVLS